MRCVYYPFFSHPRIVIVGNMSFKAAATLLTLFSLVLAEPKFSNTVYVFSNAETPSLGRQGLTPIGLKRAQTCIPAVSVFPHIQDL